MAMDSKWSLDYCLGCDRQTSGEAYCTQACRLADLETSSCGSEPESPTSLGENSFWARSTSLSKSGFYLQPAFDFGAYRSTNSSQNSHQSQPLHPMSSFSSNFQTQTPPIPPSPSKGILTPCSSHSSLSSMQSKSSQGGCLSAQAKTELRSYTNSFDCIRNWRRRMNSSQ